jgi:hypothetical protein
MWPFAIFAVVTLILAAGSIACIALLARGYSKMNPSNHVWAILGMIALGFFALAGFAATGCTAFFMVQGLRI